MRTPMMLVLAALAVPAFAQADPAAAPATAAPAATDVRSQLAVGAMVYDTQGGQVGTIEAVKGEDVVVSTGSARATLASSSFARGTNGPIIAMTRAQLENAVRASAGTPNGR